MRSNSKLPNSMKTLTFLLIASFSLTGCSILQDTEYYIQPELEFYVNEFYIEAESRGLSPQRNNLIFIIEKNVTSRWGGEGVTITEKGGLNPDTQLKCYIDEDYYNSVDSICLKQTIFHELGHGILKRGHNNTWSIMNTSVRCFGKKAEYEKRLIDELFSVD